MNALHVCICNVCCVYIPQYLYVVSVYLDSVYCTDVYIQCRACLCAERVCFYGVGFFPMWSFLTVYTQTSQYVVKHSKNKQRRKGSFLERAAKIIKRLHRTVFILLF
ncbi:mediator of RNA polymerase II transcription subunit 6 [Platysternon megacephalum]|uniref:Mediator of RNA polymerase II transcription subunit 6 n=1 Tax=Platysternon megacephalum TaxID=55544 RepID=A0A4D9F3B5_9SAUR|nr:mediator of RNA polymerase II transcription subunit 6 [Platysternon megacephalum]